MAENETAGDPADVEATDATADRETDATAALEAAIEENPEAVAEFVRRLDAVNELLDVLSLGEDALTDEMIREVAGTTATLAESADGLATEGTVGLAETVGENGAELEAALESVLELQRTGVLDELVELGGVASLLSSALDDEMVASLASTGSSLGEIADTAAEADARDGIETTLEGLAAAESEPPERVGPVGVVRAARDPEVQYGLGYVLAIARAIGRSRSTDDGPP
ncbi:DUF1641 domain protein [Natronomonas moolapensis 8.8.11]|uniref:DUF1641 domain protein n=1 Tax=Natronomonas moolapensis (strain DSM 18674 / CECT 7526 / JCM 14361 / 8.8.11) TaxID=268739 RepID=M1XLF6_NATM8|nr:DUF1641 domain-containing protein [Natronomonas moolapensis]CCQ37630.1 DUF1641 domain protein [Natronomonas moolapensis 8.8.11]